jgi:hypothetical protein
MMMGDGSLKRLLWYELKMLVLLNYRWNYYWVLAAVKAHHEEENSDTFTHIGHTEWVAKSQSLGRLGGWGKNIGRQTMAFHQMIKIMMRNLRPTQKDPYANVT